VTDLIDGLVAVLLALILNAFIVSRVQRWVPGPEGFFLARIYRWTLFVRCALAVFLNVYSDDSTFAATFWGDSAAYDAGGYLLSLYWRGDSLMNPYVSRYVSGYGFYYFVGAIYTVFGRNQLLVQFINATVGALTVLVIYSTAVSLFDRAVARWSAIFMAFFPQIVFWSGGMYKDPAIMLCIALCMFCVLKLRQRLQTSYMVLFVVSSLCLMTLRFYVFYFVVFAAIGTFLISQRRGVVQGVFGQLALVAIFVAAFSFVVQRETLDQHASYFDLGRVQITRSDQATTARSGLGAERDVSTTGGAISTLPVGFVYLMFAPFPWAISGLRQALTLPETLVWYSLMPAFVRGLRHSIRTRFKECLPILVFAAALTAAYAVFQGNVGTAYRQRTQITMFFFIFMGVGIVEKKRQRELRVSGLQRAWQQ
jgi:4-amino-4-deoxy-L-arabinose transferase-like glycosyltransferase